ncbi:ABC transporter ATP-binding protein [Ruminiclostridium cellobioparum]|jgi:ABC-2 type transport system ATP-binding protein|uniref:ABC transporter ATP-binding protein n=1 Tax=Ruminiclostridium cellobioparum TaxID=29355 RepID=UPI0028ACC73A|nr:ABC transporter ATP-binding protein [Ruminiclostridium cellobioparum]
MSDITAIEVKNLTKSFNYYKKELGLKNSIKNLFKREQLIKEAVKGISFNISEGEIVGFLGPNGAGKTTTLKMLSGILFPTDGYATVLGQVPWERKKDFKMNISIVMGQKSQLWWDLPANESLYLNKYIYEINDDEYKSSLEELTELLDVKELLKVQVRRLSLGERMKMEIIAALIHKPKVILLDEPTIGLDIISQKKIREFLKFYNQENKTTIILTSHYMKDIEEMCKRTLIVNEGIIAYDGELSKINDVFGHKKIIKLSFEEQIDKNDLEKFGKLRTFDGFNATLEVDKSTIRSCSYDILNRFPAADFNIEDIPVEEGISLLYKRG